MKCLICGKDSVGKMYRESLCEEHLHNVKNGHFFLKNGQQKIFRVHWYDYEAITKDELTTKIVLAEGVDENLLKLLDGVTDAV